MAAETRGRYPPNLLLDSKAEENERGVGKRQVVGTASCLYRTYKGCALRVQVGKKSRYCYLLTQFLSVHSMVSVALAREENTHNVKKIDDVVMRQLEILGWWWVPILHSNHG